MANIALSAVVGEFLDTIRGGEAEYALAYRMAMRGLRVLNWDVIGENVEVELPVECDMTVCLPDGFVNLVRVGIVNDKGELVPLTENQNLTMYEGGAGSPLSGLRDIPNQLSAYHNVSSYSLGVGSYANYGTYRVDLDQHRIILNPDFCHSCVVLMYLRRTEKDSDYLFNELGADALFSYIDWQWHVNKSGISTYEKEVKKNEWLRQKRIANQRIKNTTRQVMSQISRQATRQGLKG